jgi:hypothetical protein
LIWGDLSVLGAVKGRNSKQRVQKCIVYDMMKVGKQVVGDGMAERLGSLIGLCTMLSAGVLRIESMTSLVEPHKSVEVHAAYIDAIRGFGELYKKPVNTVLPYISRELSAPI